MSIKNRPTLKTQFLNFISRLAPFDGNPLIQKTEHNQVIQDHLDSQILKKDDSAAVVTAATMNLDASASDLFIIDTGAAGTAARTININNLETGQRVRVEITKKTGDTFTVPGSEWWPNTLEDGSIIQVGLTDLSFEAWNINGTIRVNLLEPMKVTNESIRLSAYIDGATAAFKGFTVNEDIWTISKLGTGGYGIFKNAVHLTVALMESSNYAISVNSLRTSSVAPGNVPVASDISRAFIYEDSGTRVSIGTEVAGSIADLNFFITIKTRQ
jgi:hypothetical protein